MLEGKWSVVFEISIISTITVLGVTGLTVELVKKLIQKKPVYVESIETVLSGETGCTGERTGKEVQVRERARSIKRKTKEMS